MTTTNTASHMPPLHSSPLPPDASSGVFCLDLSYATTRLVTQEIPAIEDLPDAAFKSLLFLPPNSERKGEGGLRTKGFFKKSLPDKPLITVITVVFNGAQHLEDTIKSVINQTYDNVEYIIIDGGSTDGTLDIIKQYEGQIDYWVSEKDKGIYDAMNKALDISIGRYVYFLNAMDTFVSEQVLHQAVSLLVQHSFPAILVGRVAVKGGEVPYYPIMLEDAFCNNAPKLFSNHLCHQALFVSRLKLQEHGKFSLQYPTFADFYSTWKIMQNGIIVYEASFVITNFFLGGVSSEFKNAVNLQIEKLNLMHHLGFTQTKYKVFISILKAHLYKFKQQFKSALK